MDGNVIVGLIGLLILALVIGVAWKGIFKIFYKYNTLLVIAYIFFLFPIAFCHILLLGLFGDSKEEILKKKAKEQAQFDKLVEEEKTLKDYRLLAERFRSDQFTSKQMTEEFKANPEFKDWYFKNYWALEKWRSI